MNLITILVGALSGVIGASLKILHDHITFVREFRNLSAACAAEVETVIEISNFRNYEHEMKMIAEAYEAGLDFPFVNFLGDLDQWRPVYVKSIDKIGSLGTESAEHYLKFHLMLNPIYMDILNLEKSPDRATNEKAEVFRKMIELWGLAKIEGGQAIKLLRATAKAPILKLAILR